MQPAQKKPQRNIQKGNFVYNYKDDYLDDIIGSLDPYPKLLPTEEAQIAESDEDYYIVEKILDRKKEGKKNVYLVKWEGFSEAQATWEPLCNLNNVKEMVKEFDKQLDISNMNQQSTSTSNINNSALQSAPLSENQPSIISEASKEIKKAPKFQKKTVTGKARGRPKKQQQQSALEQKVAETQEEQQEPMQDHQQLNLQQIQKLEQELQKLREQQQISRQNMLQQEQQQKQQDVSDQQTGKIGVKQFFAQRNKDASKQIQPAPQQQVQEKLQPAGKKVPKKRGPQKKNQEEQKQEAPAQRNQLSPSEQLDIQSLEQAMLPEVGSFETDQPKRIIGAKLSQNVIYVTIEWETRPNGIRPEVGIYTNECAKEKCPKLLVDFYESRINFKGKSQAQQQQQSAQN